MICDDCVNKFACVFDGKVERTACELYLSEINAIEAFIELLKNYVAEKRRAEKPKIVQCKDCVHWDEGHTEECCNIDSICYRNGVCKPDWFCADGEKADKK